MHYEDYNEDGQWGQGPWEQSMQAERGRMTTQTGKPLRFFPGSTWVQEHTNAEHDIIAHVIDHFGGRPEAKMDFLLRQCHYAPRQVH